jgi:hypothetical protein
MKHVFALLTGITLFTVSGNAQTLNQITILPEHPTAQDTILIISDFSYEGECSYGLVGTHIQPTDTAIYIYPVYCGYGLTSMCNSVDTFKINPLTPGAYRIEIEYHQGSICPISGFDALLFEFDTMVVVGTTGVSGADFRRSPFHIYPNPASTYFTVERQLVSDGDYHVTLHDLLGRTVFETRTITDVSRIEIPEYVRSGLYAVRMTDASGGLVGVKLLMVEL